MERKIKIVNIENKNYIVVNDEGFDWEIDPDQLKVIETKIKLDPLMKENFIGSLLNHFVVCFSEFIGKEVDIKYINEALSNGYLG